ncbi:hypothetical protein ES703_37185 [subsurface metagenome]
MAIFEDADLILTQELRRHGLGREALDGGLRTKTISACRRKLIHRLRLETPLSRHEIDMVLGLRPGSARFPKKPKP